ncbi:uncharacterized protein LOC141720117 [Apium graveolens]|uniref:uncharacterized protein LOC141720117 n=1 Tax=Apium graveolens TaxID=4045 RepID=UPI003D7B9923
MEVCLSREPLTLRVVQKGPFEFKDKEGKVKDIDDLTEAELLKYSFNGKARNSLMNGLCPSECDKVSSCKSAKEICDTLELYHEGSKSLKKEYEDVSMGEYYSLKVENSKLKDKNNYLKTMVQELMSKVDTWIDKKVPTQGDKEAEIKDLQA